jgi:uncharacterized RDD family membrane protein YckC
VIDVLVVWGLCWGGGLGARTLKPWGPVADAFWLAYLLVVPAAYFVIGHGADGQTIGKWLWGARVVASSGEPIGYVHALGRLLAVPASVLSLGLGFLLVAVRRDKRALHDLIAGTRVVRVA